jgi:hypothetical protein
MKKILFFLLTAYTSYGQGIGSSTPAVECDPFVKKELDGQGIEYTITKNGDFKIVRKMDNGRTHSVYIQSKPMSYKGIEVREIWSYARVYDSKSDVKESDVYMVLSKNATYKFGAWQIGKDNANAYYLNFSVRTATDAKGNAIKDIIDVVAMRGDEIEKELTNNADKY